MEEKSTYYHKAYELAKKGEFKEALKTIKHVFELKSEDLNDSYDIYGEILMLSGDFKEAIIQLEKAKEHPPTPIETYFNLALCYDRTYQFLDALAYIKIVLKLIDDESNFRKYSTKAALKEKKDYIAREADEMKRSIDWLLL